MIVLLWRLLFGNRNENFKFYPLLMLGVNQKIQVNLGIVCEFQNNKIYFA